MSLYTPRGDFTLDIGDGPRQPDPGMLATGRVPVGVYTSEARFAAEREIFGRVWLYVGRTEEIAKAGDWFVKEIAILSASLIIVRGKDMKIRAFHNICAHRGMKLVWDKAGRGGKFACPYHAWMYDAEGALTHIPDAGCFKHVDPQQSGLSLVACEEFEGFVFINLAPRQSLVAFLGPAAERLRGAPFGEFRHACRVADVLDANWKLGHEASSEGYHVQVLHKDTAKPMLVWAGNPFVHYPDWSPAGPHRNMLVDRSPEYRLSEQKPVQRFAFSNAPGMVIKAETPDTPKGRDFGSHPGFNQINSELWASEQFNLFPNFNIHVALNGWWSMSYWPIAPGKALWESKYYSRTPVSLREEFAAQYSLALNRDTVVEDNICLEKQQSAMQSGAKPYIQFGEQEIACSHFAAVWACVTHPPPIRLAPAE
jgi:phenylpropionate dioxygenase-like ring-hydroxylating dioxygenase large terminal subunit